MSYPEVQGLHVVVGGCGLLGSFMVKELLKAGARVRVVDARVPRPGELPPSVEFHRHVLGDMPMQDLVEAVFGALVVFTMVTADVQNGTKKMFSQLTKWVLLGWSKHVSLLASHGWCTHHQLQ